MSYSAEILFDSSILVLLSIAMGIFILLAIKSKNIRSFQFQVSVFIMIWIGGEMVEFLQSNGIFDFFDEGLGMKVHLASMLFLSIMLWGRFYMSKKAGKTMIESYKEFL